MWRATLKSLLARKVRLALTVVAIVLGVGFVSGTYVLTDTLNAAFTDVFRIATGNVDVVVRSVTEFEAGATGPGGGRSDEREALPASLVDEVATIPGVDRVAGEITGYAQMVDARTGEAIETSGSPTLGVAWNEGTSAAEIRDGRAPVDGDEVVIDAATARDRDIAIGDPIDILFTTGPRSFTVVGTIGFGEADNLAGATLAAFDVGTAQEVLDRPGKFDTLSVLGDGSLGPEALRDRVDEVLDDRYEALTGAAAAAQSAEQLQEAFGFFGTALLVFASVALFVGAFIIFNTFSIIVAQRSRELALLRALGASRRQVRLSVIAEAAVLGLIASIIGVGAGIGIAFGLQGLLTAFGLELPSTSTRVLPRTVVVSLVVGTTITLVSALLPARRASNVAPIEALRAGEAPPQAALRGRIVWGSLITAVGFGSLATGLFTDVGDRLQFVGLGTAATFLGVAVLSPLFARPMASLLGAPFRSMGMAGRLGRENAMRAPRRTASTASALMIGLGLVAFVAVFAASLRASFRVALEDTLRADFIMSTTQFQPFSPELADRLREDDAIAAVAPIRVGEVESEGDRQRVVGLDPAAIDAVIGVETRSGALSDLSGGGIAVLEDTAETYGWSMGDDIVVTFGRTGDVTLPIVAVFTEAEGLNGNLAISLEVYDDNFAEPLDQVVYLTAAEGVSLEDARAAVEAATEEYPNVNVYDQAEFKEEQEGFIDQLLGLITALLGLAIIIAFFGIVNTLGLSIFERTREIGLLRAVGMSRGQVRRMIRVESVVIAVLGAVLGIVIGVFFGWALQRALVEDGITELRIPVGQLAGYVAASAVAGVLAAVLPARRAARLDVLDAISYE